MSTLAALERYTWWLTIGGKLLLAIRIWKTGLHRTYRFFFGYLVFDFLIGVLLALTPFAARAWGEASDDPFGTFAYFWAWAATEPIHLVWYVLIVLELYSLVFQDYKGIASLSRWALLAGLAVSLTVSSLTLSLDLRRPAQGVVGAVLRCLMVLDRGVLSSLVLFLLFLALFLHWCPVPLSRNLVVHCIVFAGYFLSGATIILVRNITGWQVTQRVNIALMSTSLVCLLVWIVCLNPRGEARKVLIRKQWGAGEEDELLQQLASINSTLRRAARK